MKRFSALLLLSILGTALTACGQVPQAFTPTLLPQTYLRTQQTLQLRSDQTLQTIAKRMRELTFYKLDADRDGRLLPKEMPVSVSDFSAVDADSDGMITLDEFHAAKGKLPQTVDMQYLREHARMLWTEANRDQNGVLLFQEVLQVLKSLQGPGLSPQEQERQARLVFMLGDTDHTGSLTFSEFEDLIAQITLNDHLNNPIQTP